ncbi:TGF-beta-activated kinase 1 and MAP3K7-binding protein 2-like isoform X2 [Pollicipes pollicipes]|uniref:TGF-beta-activated kinase 1 and MAP3K7-binding protein 2-like isoform X2 n=1 Tax=Pollicipes pollicipes TaxID=41117 RepID=UPI0018857059|nr:TGF-beta-activated kinase 1 and MAP3K7-binding protein 2-like isoform X2 [Pollicipes pollicipes]
MSRDEPPPDLAVGMEDVRIGDRPVFVTPPRRPVWQPQPSARPVVRPPAAAAAADPALLRSQEAAYNRLRCEMERNTRLYESLLADTNLLMRQLEMASAPVPDERVRLAEDNSRWRRSCELLSADVRRLRAEEARRHLMSYSSEVILSPPGPPEEPAEGPQWECGSCTFLNHPAIGVCEQCEMPRLRRGTGWAARSPPSSLPPPHSGCYCHPAGGGASADRVCSWPESSARPSRGAQPRLGTL